MKIEVFPFQQGQEELVCTIHNAAFAYWIEEFGEIYRYKQVHPADVASWVEDNDDSMKNLWIAFLDGTPAGYASSRLELDQDGTSTLLFIETSEGLGQSRIAVMPEYQRQGIGSAIVKLAMEFYRNLGATKATIVLYSDNHPGANFVQTLGFKKEFYATLGELNLQQQISRVHVNSDVVVRPLEERDLEAVTCIIQQSRPDLLGTFSTFEKVKEFYTREQPLVEVSLVAELNGEVVGLMDFTPEGRVGIGGVMPECRNQGVGSTLFYQLLTTMQARGKKKAVVDTGSIYSDAIKMYKRFGFDTSRFLWDWTRKIE